jgi:predicted TIM-barrel fold metal-dependent hydrolase
MPRPTSVAAVDLMVSLPSGTAGSWSGRLAAPGKGATGTNPVEYLFGDGGGRKDEARDPEKVVAAMDAHGVAIAQIRVDPDDPAPALALFERWPDRFIGEVWIDCNRGMEGVRAIERAARAHRNVRSVTVAPGFINPPAAIDDRKWYPVYAKCAELGLPINVFVGVPGPRVPYKYQHPGLLDEVAWFFPELKIVMRHGGEPWTALCCKLLLKWPNLYYSTSAFAPKYYPRDVLDFASRRGADKLLFAGYYPLLGWDRIFAEMDDLPLREHVWAPFLRDNAVAVYGLGDIIAPHHKGE